MLVWRVVLKRSLPMLIPDPLMVNAVLTNIYGEGFVNWEPETLEIELIKLKDKVLSRYGKDELITNLINAIRAIRSPKSFVLDEWHILEKAMVAITGKPVLFFEAQPAGSLHELMLGVELIKELLNENGEQPDDLGLSEETKAYLGFILIDMGVFYFPFEPYKSIIEFALTLQKPDDAAKAIIDDFKAKLTDFLKDKEAVVNFLQLMEDQPDLDLLAELKNVNLFNAVTAVCAYITVRSHVESSDSAADKMADDTPKELAVVPETSTPEQEGISAETVSEILKLTDSDGSVAIKTASARESAHKLPREGTYIISKDADEFDPDHKYENVGGASGSVVSRQTAGEKYNGPKPVNSPDLGKLVPKNESIKDALSQIFANLDI